MEGLFGDLVEAGVLTYIDDILLHAATEEGIIELFERVLSRLEEAGAKIKMEKVKIVPERLKYLGHIIEAGKRRPDVSRVEALGRVKTPSSLRDVRRILGVLNWFRHYIPHYSELIRPVSRLLSPKYGFHWTAECTEAVEKACAVLREAALSVPVVGSAFRLETDASDEALGAVLYSKDEYDKDPKTLPIMFISKTLTPTERNWSTAEREAYAILWALRKTDGFVRGREVEVITDHKNLQWMMGVQVGKISRWTSLLAEYQITVKHRSGKEHMVADFLSRNIAHDPVLEKKMTIYALLARVAKTSKLVRIKRAIKDEDEVVAGTPSDRPIIAITEEDDDFPLPKHWDSDAPPNAYDAWRARICSPEDPVREEAPNVVIEAPEVKAQVECTEEVEDVFPPVHWFRERVPVVTLNEIREVQKTIEKGTMTRGMRRHPDGLITYLGGAWVPPALRLKALDFFHLSTGYWHPGMRKMISLLKSRMTWEGQQKDVSDYIAGCVICQRSRSATHMPTSTGSHPVDGPFETLYCDFWGPITWNGRTQLFMTMIDYCTKWVEIIAIKDKSAAVITREWFIRWVSQFGAPRRIMTDQDKPFISQSFQCLTIALGTMKLTSTPYHPQGNAPIESFHKTLGAALDKIRQRYESTLTLEEAVAWVLLGYRAQPHTSTGYSPGFLTHGVDPRISDKGEASAHVKDVLTQGRLSLLGDIRNEIRERAIMAQEKLAASDEVKEPKYLKVGIKALVQLTERQHRALSRVLGSSKLAPTWSLPMQCMHVRKNKQSGLFRCSTTGLEMETHISRVRELPEPASEALNEENQQVLQAEKALMHLLVLSYRNVGPRLEGLGEPHGGIKIPPSRPEGNEVPVIEIEWACDEKDFVDILQLPWEARVRRYWKQRAEMEGCTPPDVWRTKELKTPEEDPAQKRNLRSEESDHPRKPETAQEAAERETLEEEESREIAHGGRRRAKRVDTQGPQVGATILLAVINGGGRSGEASG